MERELQRLRENDRKYGLNFAPMAENLEKKFNDDIKEKIQLEQEINGGSKIYQNCHKQLATPFGRIKNSGGHYIRFGNNQVQEQIIKQHIAQVSKKM